MDNSSPIETPASTESTVAPGEGKPKKPTGITGTFGYRTKPPPATGFKIIVGFGVTIAAVIMLRLLAAPDGGPLMAAYNYVVGLFSGGAPK